MSRQTMQGRFNAQKEKFLLILKQEGVFVEHCKERGFIYELVRPIYGQMTRLMVSLKNGHVLVLQMESL